jgi:hypothetical protein
MLPRKLHQDAAAAQDMQSPERWRSMIEAYRQRVSERE